MSNLDINKLLDEVEQDVKSLLKSAQDDAAKLSKADPKKEESSSSSSSSSSASKSMAKADDDSGSSYENQAPEASAPVDAAPAPEAPAEDPSAAPAPEEEAENMEHILKDLDDDMLHELYQKIKMELMGRMQAQEGSDAPSEEQPPQPAPDASAAPAMSPDMAMQRSEKDFSEKLQKAETVAKEKDAEIEKLRKNASDLEKSLADTLDLVKSVMERPVTRAVTDIQFVSKGEEGLKKSEAATMSDEDLKKAANNLAKDKSKLGALTKSERDVLIDYLSGKPVKEKMFSFINK